MTSSADVGITVQDITASWNKDDNNNPTLNKISFCFDQVNYKIYFISYYLKYGIEIVSSYRSCWFWKGMFKESNDVFILYSLHYFNVYWESYQY